MRRRALERLGHHAAGVDLEVALRGYGAWARRPQWWLRCGPIVRRYNDAILAAVTPGTDMVWIDKGLFVTPATLAAARARGVRWLVHYSPDNYRLAQNTSRHLRRALPLYDMVVTTKPAGLGRLAAQGARRVSLSDNAFDPEVHRPVTLGEGERYRFAADVAFIGRWEPARERLLDRLAAIGVSLAVWGPHWQRARSARVRGCYRGSGVVADAYAKAVNGARIVLGLLSERAGDTITQRSIEIPACGAFMLAPRTEAHTAAFREGVEAEFFGSFDEMVAKIRHYLRHSSLRARIAAAGRQRCLTAGYSYPERMRVILHELGVDALAAGA
jgi:spore maturation protein CgeB